MNTAPDVVALRGRLRKLEQLRAKTTSEINDITDRLADLGGTPRRRFRRPPCGTPAGYQWHRYHEPDRWPLPKDDPCGCRAAHNQQRRIKDQINRTQEEA